MSAIGRRSVQEQNGETQQRMRSLASSFQADPLRFSWLVEALQSKSMPPEEGILVSLSHVPEQDGELYNGMWLTRQRQFFEFVVLLPRNDAELEIEGWKDVSSQMTVSAHQPGIGKSFALLALEILGEFTAS